MKGVNIRRIFVRHYTPKDMHSDGDHRIFTSLVYLCAMISFLWIIRMV